MIRRSEAVHGTAPFLPVARIGGMPPPDYYLSEFIRFKPIRNT